MEPTNLHLNYAHMRRRPADCLKCSEAGDSHRDDHDVIADDKPVSQELKSSINGKLLQKFLDDPTSQAVSALDKVG